MGCGPPVHARGPQLLSNRARTLPGRTAAPARSRSILILLVSETRPRPTVRSPRECTYGPGMERWTQTRDHGTRPRPRPRCDPDADRAGLFALFPEAKPPRVPALRAALLALICAYVHPGRRHGRLWQGSEGRSPRPAPLNAGAYNVVVKTTEVLFRAGARGSPCPLRRRTWTQAPGLSRPLRCRRRFMPRRRNPHQPPKDRRREWEHGGASDVP